MQTSWRDQAGVCADTLAVSCASLLGRADPASVVGQLFNWLLGKQRKAIHKEYGRKWEKEVREEQNKRTQSCGGD